jgi:hypothetical protein
MSKVPVLAVVLGLVACRDSTPQKKPTESSPPVAAANQDGGATAGSADPWVAVDVDARPVTPEEKQKRAEEAVARVATIQPKLAKLRDLPLKKPVPAAYQSTADFKAFLKREIEKELPADKARDMEASMLHIGLLEKPIDLPATLIRTMETQAAAYYDPAQKKFFVVMAPDSESLLDTMSAHELTHALQDQNFDLAKYLPTKLDEDQQNARRFVVEGDATFTMFMYSAGDASPQSRELVMGLARSQVEAMAAMDIQAFAEQMKQQAAAFTAMDPDMRKSMESVGELPPAIIGPLIDSYMKGALLAMTAYEHGGWKAVDELFKNPPESTEQVLHPKEKLYPKREAPKKITMPKLEGKAIADNVLGELQWTNYMRLWKVAKPEATAGWGGDHYSVAKDKDGHLTAIFVTAWDSENDAKEFLDAYLATLPARFSGADATKATTADGVARPDFGKVFVRQVKDRVFIVDGAADTKLLDRVVKEAKIK